MSEANIQVLKDGFDKFLSGDIPGFLELVSQDVQWDHRGPEGVPFNKLYEGRAAVAEFFQVMMTAQQPVVFEPREFFSSGDRVVCLGFFRWTVPTTTKEWESDFAMAVTIRNSQITEWRIMFDMSVEAAALRS